MSTPTSRLTKLLSLPRLLRSWTYLVRMVERMQDNNLFLSGAAIAFNAILCFLPIVLLVFFFAGLYLPQDDAVRVITDALEQSGLVPFGWEGLATALRDLLSGVQRGASLAGIVGILGVIWASSALFSAVRTALNRIYGARDSMNIFVSKVKDIALILVIGLVLVAMFTFSHAILLIRPIAESVFNKELSGWLFSGVAPVALSFMAIFVGFVLVFVFFPDTRLPWRIVYLSSFSAAILWSIGKGVLGYYFVNLWSLGSVYGPYAILVALALYVYYSSITFLASAEIGQMAIERRFLRRLFAPEELRRTRERLQIFGIEEPRPHIEESHVPGKNANLADSLDR